MDENCKISIQLPRKTNAGFVLIQHSVYNDCCVILSPRMLAGILGFGPRTRLGSVGFVLSSNLPAMGSPLISGHGSRRGARLAGAEG